VRRIREVLRYHYELRLSNGRISSALEVSKGSVHNILQRFKQSSWSWPLPDDCSDTALEEALYPSVGTGSRTCLPDVPYLEHEVSRPHVTLQLLWDEYHATHPEGMSRSTFYRYYHQHRTKPSDLKMIHKGGDKLFIDYSGDGLEYIDRKTGEVIPAELFVCSWGASSYSYAEATHTQNSDDFIAAQVRALLYFGVGPHALVPDNLKSGVKKADRYDPEINPLYAKFAEHHGAAVLPARVKKPKDKAVAESNVLHLQRFILGRLRDRTFYSLAEINEAVRELLDEFNLRPMKDYGGRSRKDRFEELDKPYGKPLPSEPFRITRIKTKVRVGPNYHLRYDDHFYSAPHWMARRYVDVYQVGPILEVYHNGVHCCRHRKSFRKYGYTTVPEHMPPNHQFVRGWSAGWFLGQAGEIGPSCREVVHKIMKRMEHVQQGFNAALGVLRLAKAYSPERLEAACKRADHYKSYSLKALKSILEKNLDQQQTLALEPPHPTVEHANIRGAAYYQT
jgi:transposase